MLLVTVLSLRALLPVSCSDRQLPQNPVLSWEKLRELRRSRQSPGTLMWATHGHPKSLPRVEEAGTPELQLPACHRAHRGRPDPSPGRKLPLPAPHGHNTPASKPSVRTPRLPACSAEPGSHRFAPAGVPSLAASRPAGSARGGRSATVGPAGGAQGCPATGSGSTPARRGPCRAAPKRPLARSPPTARGGPPTPRSARTRPGAPAALLPPNGEQLPSMPLPRRSRAPLPSTTATVCRPPPRTRLPTAPGHRPPPAPLASPAPPALCVASSGTFAVAGTRRPRPQPRRLQPQCQRPSQLAADAQRRLRRPTPARARPPRPEQPPTPAPLTEQAAPASQRQPVGHGGRRHQPHRPGTFPARPPAYSRGPWRTRGRGHQPPKRQPGLLGQQRRTPDPDSGLLKAKELRGAQRGEY